MNMQGPAGDFDIFIRSIVSVTVLFIITRIMGKKSIAHLTFFDYIVGTAIGSIAAALTVDESIKYSHGIIGLVVWGVSAVIIAYISVKSIPGRRILGSTPTILVQNGKVLEKNLKKEKFNINDFLEELRLKGVFSVSDVEFAMLETNGQVSIQLKSQKQPVTPEDLSIPTQYKGLSAVLMIDGKIMHNNLKQVGLDENWLMAEMKRRGINSTDEVLLASLDTSGNLYIDTKGDNTEELKISE